jgi:hypothetical protein
MGEVAAELCSVGTEDMSRCVALIDKHFSFGDEKVRTVIYTGFLEYLFGRPECAPVIASLTIELKQEFDSIQ